MVGECVRSVHIARKDRSREWTYMGSNATCLGGSCGRADAATGAVEAQKAEGVLHLHLYVFGQMLHQYLNLAEIGALLRQQLVSVDAMKRFVSYFRCAVYPRFEQFQE